MSKESKKDSLRKSFLKLRGIKNPLKTLKTLKTLKETKTFDLNNTE